MFNTPKAAVAREILRDWPDWRGRFVKVMPQATTRCVLDAIKKPREQGTVGGRGPSWRRPMDKQALFSGQATAHG